METRTERPLLIWLLLGCLLVLSMVVVGGITRLTHSGLSMVEWSLFMGSVPPMNEVDWQDLFQKYQQFPEFKELNYDFALQDFKQIFWWEYIHRMLGRLIGVVFLVPFFYFWLKKKLNARLVRQLLVVFAMGAFQAFLGWFMVKSGLSKEPRVSHFRLAAHLITAFLTCTYIFWIMLDVWYRDRTKEHRQVGLLRWSQVLWVVLLIQIVWGAFVAGMKAGLIHNTFPLMDDQFIAPSALQMEPFYENFIRSASGIQLMHRMLAYAVVILAGVVWWKGRSVDLGASQKIASNALLSTVLLQFVLGVLTLVMSVPLLIALFHQVNALLLLLAATWLVHRLR